MICILTSLSFLAHAGEGSERASVEELLMLMKADSMIDNIYSQYGQTIKRMEQQLSIDQSNKAIFERYISRMVAIMKQEMNWKKMKRKRFITKNQRYKPLYLKKLSTEGEYLPRFGIHSTISFVIKNN